MKTKEFLDKTLEDFFPQQGVWYSNCFSKLKTLEENNLPCHIRDNNWLADFIIKKYNLDLKEKDAVLNYIVTSEQFNKLRYEYEQRIVSWQIDWMCNGGENWIVDTELGGELYLFSTKCDYAFRKCIVDTLLAIGMNRDAIEEGIEKNADKWRENHMRLAFHNLYSVSKYGCSKNQMLEEPSQEHYEKWLKLRLYEYYIEHKDSVDKYGEVLPEMKMSELEVAELKKWLEIAHEERIKQIAEYKNKNYVSDIPKMDKIDFYESDFPRILKIEKLKYSEKSDKADKTPRLDFKTWLYLYVTKALRVEHIPVVEVEEKRRMNVKDYKENEVYTFKDYDEYKKFFLMYLDDIENDVIDLAIYTRGNKGQIVALKQLCEYIIVKKQCNNFYDSISLEQIVEIHSKGKLTPLEVVELWESHDLCIEGNKTMSSKNRCRYFNQNCHECLMETASHKLEHDNIDFKVVNSMADEQGPILKKTRK